MIDIRTYGMGQDRVFLITGGVAHIGACAMAYLTTEGDVRVEAQSLPGHRERELAAELASLAASALRCTVTVLMGIHLDKPSKQEITDVVEEARCKARIMLEQL